MISGIEVTGTKELQDILARLGDAAPDKLGDALYRQAEFIMTEAKRQTPVDTGSLRASGHVEPPVVNGTQVSVMLGFGGVAGGQMNNEQGPVGPGQFLTSQGTREPGQYAIYVHENLNAQHPSGNAKFLENPMLATELSLSSKLATDLKIDLEGMAAR